MTAEIIRELTVIKDTREVTIQQVLFLTKRIEVQQPLKAMLQSLKETKDFNMILIPGTWKDIQQVWKRKSLQKCQHKYP